MQNAIYGVFLQVLDRKDLSLLENKRPMMILSDVRKLSDNREYKAEMALPFVDETLVSWYNQWYLRIYDYVFFDLDYTNVKPPIFVVRPILFKGILHYMVVNELKTCSYQLFNTNRKPLAALSDDYEMISQDSLMGTKTVVCDKSKIILHSNITAVLNFIKGRWI